MYNPTMPAESPAEQELTVVIPVYNEAQSLPRFLPELIATCRARNWQLTLVNDGSKDDSARILAFFHPRVETGLEKFIFTR